MSNRQADSKRKSQSDKLLQKFSKKSQPSNKLEVQASALKEQYDIIRNDLLKLRNDLSKGYDMARGMIDKKSIMRQLKKSNRM